MKQIVEVHEFYYGEGEVRGNKTYLLCFLEPGRPRPKPINRLVLDVQVPVEGSMVVETIRYTKFFKNGSWRRQGAPVKVIGITYDPNPDPSAIPSWRGKLKGEWRVRRVRIRRRSVWERLR